MSLRDKIILIILLCVIVFAGIMNDINVKFP